MNKKKHPATEFVNAVIYSYSQVFFSKSKVLAAFLVVISFFDYGAGLGGIISVLTANLLAYSLGYNKYFLRSGLYGFNALLTGLGIGLIYQPSLALLVLIVISAITCFFLTIVFQGVLGKYGLPFLSVPFLITIWIAVLSGNSLTALHISERGIFVYNELYALGGKNFVDFYNTLEDAISSPFIKVYFHSLGAIFFQSHLLAGILIATALVIFSRITFLLSVLGYSVAFLFYRFVGIEFNTLNYTFIGFNYILTAIALGGYYLVPNRISIGWTMLLLPAVVLIAVGTQQLFSSFMLGPYSLPFNMVVLMFLYSLKLREVRPINLVETPVQLGNPEKNLYLYSGNMKRFPSAFPVSASLPFYGEWQVTQGHNGEQTHRGPWQNAWDFVITDSEGKQYRDSGDFAEDYYCFGKAVIAPFDGIVAEVLDHIHDNKIGDINTRENWGNTVIIKHNEFLYAKLSHLQLNSIEVKPGDHVKQGQMLGRCGNSGRSPYPHLHFQFQATPFTGSATINYPFGNYLLNTESGYRLVTFGNPKKDDLVANLQENKTLEKALHFIPGQRLNVQVQVESSKTRRNKLIGNYTWVVETDVYNTTCLRDEAGKGIAYLFNNGHIHYFTNFNGIKNSPLFWFFHTLYIVPMGFLPKSKINDTIPVNLMFGGVLKIIQDFTAPILMFLKAEYELIFLDVGSILDGQDVKMYGRIVKKMAGRTLKEFGFELKISESGTIGIEINQSDAKIKMVCVSDRE